MDCSPPGSSVHRILQARILEWVAISFSMGFSQPWDRTCVSCIAGRFSTKNPRILYWATKRALKAMKPLYDTVMVDMCHQFSSVQSLSRVQLFATPWIAAHQASLSITYSQSPLRLMSIESVMPSSHLILSSPSPPAPNPSQHQSLYQWVNSSHEVAKVLEFQL